VLSTLLKVLLALFLVNLTTIIQYGLGTVYANLTPFNTISPQTFIDVENLYTQLPDNTIDEKTYAKLKDTIEIIAGEKFKADQFWETIEDQDSEFYKKVIGIIDQLIRSREKNTEEIKVLNGFKEQIQEKKK
jgi:hypothetical protein